MQRDLFVDERETLLAPPSPARRPALHQWFTPAWAADLLVEDALKGIGPASILDPACGDGALLQAVPSTLVASGIEIDPLMAQAARERTGRPVICADLRSANFRDFDFQVLVANPPFDAGIIDAIVDKAYNALPEGGLIALVLPAHIPASSKRIDLWSARFSIETKLLPRAIFPRLSLPLVWTRLIKAQDRTLVGLFLFDEQLDVSAMPDQTRRRLSAGATWREIIQEALRSLGGLARLKDIYQAVEPRRKSPNPHWRDKTRQVLAQYGCTFIRVDDERWQLTS